MLMELIMKIEKMRSAFTRYCKFKVEFNKNRYNINGGVCNNKNGTYSVGTMDGVHGIATLKDRILVII